MRLKKEEASMDDKKKKGKGKGREGKRKRKRVEVAGYKTNEIGGSQVI